MTRINLARSQASAAGAAPADAEDYFRLIGRVPTKAEPRDWKSAPPWALVLLLMGAAALLAQQAERLRKAEDGRESIRAEAIAALQRVQTRQGERLGDEEKETRAANVKQSETDRRLGNIETKLDGIIDLLLKQRVIAKGDQGNGE